MSDTEQAPQQTPRTPVIPPTQDDPAGIQTGDFGLNPNLHDTIVEALEQRWNADDPGATPPLDDETPPATHPGIPSTADTAATPAPAPDPGPGAPVTADQAGAGGGGDADGEGAAPIDPSAPPAPAPTVEEEFDLNQYARQYFGTDLAPGQARELFRLFGGLQAMDQNQRAALDQILAGGAPPMQQPMHERGAGGAEVTPVQPPAQTPGLPPRPDDEYEAAIYDKLIAPFATTVQQQLGGMQQEIAQQTQQRLEAERRQAVAEIETASNAWRAKYPVLTDGEFDALTDRVVRSGVFPQYLNNLGPTRATEQVLEQFFWADENLRARAVANIASGRQPGDPAAVDPSSPITQAANDAAQGRQARAASVAGGGGAPTSHTPKTPTTHAERQDAMQRELEAHFQGG